MVQNVLPRDVSDIVFSRTEAALLNGEEIATVFIDMERVTTYQLSFVSSAPGLTIEISSKPDEAGPTLTDSFTYSASQFYTGTDLVRQRFMRFKLINNTGSTVTSAALEVKLLADNGDGATAAPLDSVTRSSDLAINTKSTLIGQGSGSTFNNMKIGSDGAVRTASYPYEYDYIEVTNPSDTQEVYTYKSGGSGGTTVGTITINYTDSTKAVLSNVART